jgi:lipopolysaccharide export system protein LptC
LIVARAPRPVRLDLRAALLVALLVAVSALSFWFRISSRHATPPLAAAARLPDYYLEGMERRELDGTGRVRSVLRTERLEHFSDDDSATLVRPSLEIYNDDGWSWLVQAESGWSNGAGTEVMLHGQVDIRQRDAAGSVRLHVATSELHVLPQAQFAETDRAATIREPRSVATGVGLRANLAENRVELLTQVTIQYDQAE